MTDHAFGPADGAADPGPSGRDPLEARELAVDYGDAQTDGTGIPAGLESGTVAGAIERVTYHNPETGFCVLRVQARGHRGLVTVVGNAPAVAAGEAVEAAGAWVNDRAYGVQFRAETLATAAPTSLDGLEKYLGSGLVHGIGPVFARKLVDLFGEELLTVIEREPERLRGVEGVGPWRARQITSAFAEQRVLRDIALFLHRYGVDGARVVRIHKCYGPHAVALIRDNPYRLVRDIRGFGFEAADRLALGLGVGRTAPLRIEAGITASLVEAMNEGHCGLPLDVVRSDAARLLGVGTDLVDAALARADEAGEVVIDEVEGRRCLFLAGLHGAERALARRLARMALEPVEAEPVGTEAAIDRAEAAMGVTLAEGQREALRLALATKLIVITGGPGVGKTTLVRGILHALAERGATVALCAPTGRAAKRLAESTGMEARTIHRLLEVDGFDQSFRRGPTRPLDCDWLVVDETSMVDLRLMHALVRALPEGAGLVLVGDVDQLPSIGAGQVLADVIGSGAVPVVRLTEVFRQAAASRIVASAHRINRGEVPDLEPVADSDFYFVEADDAEEGVHKLVTLVRERIPKRFGLDPVRDIQVLAPMNRGGLGVRSLNLTLQAALNPARETRVQRFGWTYSPGDRIMQVQNDYEREVYNGDVGQVLRLDPEAETLTALFDGREVSYGFGELDALVLAYATTIHKAQGSEYPAVVVPLTLDHAPMLRRNLLYTGVTRGSRLVVLLGQRAALQRAVREDGGGRRWSRLREALQEADAAQRAWAALKRKGA
ncbi:MAG TPA: ATP-dependent RecD-like DNA helicase [Microvirga sp.]|jgi:exodeoxyribonuclease V alpha subunit|nr:ATP-dependent RecD-like DNA helicase [Microvirga sp.]